MNHGEVNMNQSEKEGELKWIIENYSKVPLGVVVTRLQSLLEFEIGEEGDSLDTEISKRLGRELTPMEIYQLRPILMEIEANYYGEE